MVNTPNTLDKLGWPDLACLFGAREMFKRNRLIVGAAAALVVVAGGIAAVVLLNSHHAPGSFALTSPTPAGVQGTLAGSWKVASGSEAGYRVREKFINQPGPTEAVARTTKVTGSLKVASGSGSALTATSIHFTIDLTALTSQDKYATFQTYQRDFFIRQIYLQTAEFPTADFTATSVTLPTDITAGPVTVTTSGSLKVHGVTKNVTTQLQAQLNGNEIEVAGSISVDMRDFNVEVPDISFTKAEPGVIIEYHLLLARG